MDDEIFMNLDLSEMKLRDLLISAVQVYPIFIGIERIFEYNREDTDEINYFIANENQEPGILADYLIFPGYKSLEKFLTNYIRYEENPNIDVDIMDENVLFFTIFEGEDVIRAEAAFGGNLKNLSAIEKNAMINEFLKGTEKVVVELKSQIQKTGE